MYPFNITSQIQILFGIITLTIVVLFVYFLGYVEGKKQQSEKGKRSQKWSRSVLGGLFSEQVAPFLPDFPKDLKASEARFIGKPIDFLIFRGMDEQNIEEVVFVEIKSGKSQLTQNERKLKEAINNKNVRWCEYRVDGDITTFSDDSI